MVAIVVWLRKVGVVRSVCDYLLRGDLRSAGAVLD
jgi:hypothetical protein